MSPFRRVVPASLVPRTMAGGLALSAVAWIGVWALGLLLAFNVLLSSVLAGQVDASLRARAEAVAATIDVRAGRLVIAPGNDEALDAGTSIYLGTSLVEGIDLAPELRAQLVQHGPVTADRELLGPIRYLASPIRAGGRQVGTVVVSSDTGALSRTRWIVGAATLTFIVLLLIFTFFALRGTVTRAMRPVRVMGDQASAWSHEDLDRRFDPDAGPTELRRLAATLNSLLERISATLRHERDFTAELSHELRTPLAHLHAEVDLLQGTDESADIAGLMTSVRRLESLVESALVPARARQSSPPGMSRLHDVLADLPMPDGTDVVISGDRNLLLAAEGEIVRRALLPLLENACRYARHRVRIDIATHAGKALLQVRDDGGRLGEDQTDSVFAPGYRAEPGDGHPGAGLGLALSRRIARSAGGDVTAAAEEGWSVFVLTVPYVRSGADVA